MQQKQMKNNIFERRLAVNKSRTAYMKLLTEENFKRMKQKIRIEYFNVFSDKLSDKLSFSNESKHRIILKNEKKIIKKRMMRVFNKYLKVFKQ